MIQPLILVLDDEALVAFDLSALLEERGYRVSGPHTSEAAALDAIAREAPDAALLDVNLGSGTSSARVAETLDGLGVPFAFLTGYARLGDRLDARFRDRPRIGKPFDRPRILELLSVFLDPPEAGRRASG